MQHKQAICAGQKGKLIDCEYNTVKQRECAVKSPDISKEEKIEQHLPGLL